MGTSFLPYHTFTYIYSKVRRFCIDLLLHSENGILLTKRSIDPMKGYWHLPGGTVLRNETIHQAISRIALEEIVTDVTIVGLSGIIEYNEKSGPGRPISAVYTVRPILPPKNGSQSSEIRYFMNIPEMTLLEVKHFLQKNLA